jgi:hypothetical protein
MNSWDYLGTDDGHTMNHVTYIGDVSSGGTAAYAKDGSIFHEQLRTAESPKYT